MRPWKSPFHLESHTLFYKLDLGMRVSELAAMATADKSYLKIVVDTPKVMPNAVVKITGPAGETVTKVPDASGEALFLFDTIAPDTQLSYEISAPGFKKAIGTVATDDYSYLSQKTISLEKLGQESSLLSYVIVGVATGLIGYFISKKW